MLDLSIGDKLFQQGVFIVKVTVQHLVTSRHHKFVPTEPLCFVYKELACVDDVCSALHATPFLPNRIKLCLIAETMSCLTIFHIQKRYNTQLRLDNSQNVWCFQKNYYHKHAM